MTQVKFIKITLCLTILISHFTPPSFAVTSTKQINQVEKLDKLFLPASEEGKFACIANCEEKVARVEKDETINSYIFSDIIRICGPAANEETAQWMQKTINEGWSAPDIYYKGKNMIVDVKVIYDKDIECNKHFELNNIANLNSKQNNPSDTVIRVFHNDLIEGKNTIERHPDFNFSNPEVSRKNSTQGYMGLCRNYGEISLSPFTNQKNNHSNKFILMHEFGHLLCLLDKYNDDTAIFFKNDVMGNQLLKNTGAQINVSKRNVVETIHMFDCYRKYVSNNNDYASCVKANLYDKFDNCLYEQSFEAVNKYIGQKCIQPDGYDNMNCIVKIRDTVLPKYKEKILNTCNKLLPVN